MASYAQRPQAAAAFLNPALLAVVQAAAAKAYERERAELMVWPMAPLVSALVLHRPTRAALPRTVSTHLSSWVSQYPVLVAGLGPRTSSLLPSIREGLRFGLRHELLALERGRLRGLLGSTRGLEGELADLVKSASLVGRWTARTDRPSTVFALLGVRP